MSVGKFKCANCGAEFEGSYGAKMPVCPKCGSNNVYRIDENAGGNIGRGMGGGSGRGMGGGSGRGMGGGSGRGMGGGSGRGMGGGSGMGRGRR